MERVKCIYESQSNIGVRCMNSAAARREESIVSCQVGDDFVATFMIVPTVGKSSDVVDQIVKERCKGCPWNTPRGS